MDATVVSDVFQDAMNQANYAALASDIFRRARVAGGIFDGNHDGVADFIFAAGFQRSTQSGRALGASGVAPNFSASRCCEGPSA